MEIDLLATRKGELGLVCDKTPASDVSCIMFDVAERSLTLEFGESMDSIRLNVPVGDDFVPMLHAAADLHFCAAQDGRMTYARQVPLMTVAGDEDADFPGAAPSGHGVTGVQSWLQNSVTGQPVHRDNLGDSGSNGGIMHRAGLSPATMRAAPQLAKALAAEQQLVQSQQLRNAPRMAPPSLGPGTASPTMGLGTLVPRAPRRTDESDD